VAENIRALPPGGPKYTAAFGWRQSIENDNNQSDKRKLVGVCWARKHSMQATRQASYL
jgi:hypothetical protein